jgi:hypothetical protein
MERDVSTGGFQVRIAAARPAGRMHCAMCWGQRSILEPSPLGLIPVVCATCAGTGRHPPR